MIYLIKQVTASDSSIPILVSNPFLASEHSARKTQGHRKALQCRWDQMIARVNKTVDPNSHERHTQAVPVPYPRTGIEAPSGNFTVSILVSSLDIVETVLRYWYGGRVFLLHAKYFAV